LGLLPELRGTGHQGFSKQQSARSFYCTTCNEEYELKSEGNGFGKKVLDGAYHVKCERLAASNNPSLFLLNYDLQNLHVTNLFVVPKHFFVREIIEERKPLAATARRAGWIGSHIRLDRMPASGRIFLVRGGVAEPKEAVLAQWQRTLFLRDQPVEARGWLMEVMKCIESIGRAEFDLADVYAFETALARLYPDNRNVRPKIRQQLQFLRDRGYLEFTSRGHYRLHPSNSFPPARI